MATAHANRMACAVHGVATRAPVMLRCTELFCHKRATKGHRPQPPWMYDVKISEPRFARARSSLISRVNVFQTDCSLSGFGFFCFLVRSLVGLSFDKTPLAAGRGRREDVCVAAHFPGFVFVAAVPVRGPLFIIATDALGSLLAPSRGVPPPSCSRSDSRRGFCWSGESSICCGKARPSWLENCLQVWQEQARASASARPRDM